MHGFTEVTIDVSDHVKEEVEGLARRRYGSDEEAVSRVVDDLFRSQVARWDMEGMSLSETLWSWVIILRVPFLRRKAWGRLLTGALACGHGGRSE